MSDAREIVAQGMMPPETSNPTSKENFENFQQRLKLELAPVVLRHCKGSASLASAREPREVVVALNEIKLACLSMVKVCESFELQAFKFLT